jgi:hypothetical protein
MRWKRLKIFGIVALCCILALGWGIYDFLAINHPVEKANILVVEGWIWKSSAMMEAVEKFKQGHYDWLVTVGEPIDNNDSASNYTKTSAELAARRLQELSVSEKRIVILPVPIVKQHQTYTSALTLRKWLLRSKTETTGINVFTLGTHARKSLVLFQRALGPRIKVGVFAGTEDTFDPSRWWLSNRGIYVVGRKALGYLYALFWPLPYEGSN